MQQQTNERIKYKMNPQNSDCQAGRGGEVLRIRRNTDFIQGKLNQKLLHV